MSEATQSFPGAFCEPCNTWRKPSMLMPDGSCPKCRTVLEDTDTSGTSSADAEAEGPSAAEAAKIPWHFWVMVAATVLYLGWRVIQGVGSLF